MHDCPADYFIPIYMKVFGVMLLILDILVSFQYVPVFKLAEPRQRLLWFFIGAVVIIIVVWFIIGEFKVKHFSVSLKLAII